MKEKSKIQTVGEGPPWDEELRLWLVNWMAEHPHLTPLVLARKEHVGVSRTMIDSYLKCAYFVDGLPSHEAAARFGYTPGSFRILCHQFRRDPTRRFFEPSHKGPRPTPAHFCRWRASTNPSPACAR